MRGTEPTVPVRISPRISAFFMRYPSPVRSLPIRSNTNAIRFVIDTEETAESVQAWLADKPEHTRRN